MAVHKLLTVSIFAYHPTASDPAQVADRALIFALKDRRPDATRDIQRRVALPAPLHRDLFSPDRLLVPLPPSARRPPEDWPIWPLASALAAQEGGAVKAALLRKRTLPAAHLSAPHERPTVRDVASSLVVDRDALRGVRRITLVDDVLTSGTTAIGALLALREAGWDGPTRLFTVACTSNGDAHPTPIQGTAQWDDALPERPYARCTPARR